MTCETFELFFSFIIDNEPIPEENRKECEAHLKKCPQCQKKLAEFQDLDHTIRNIVSKKINIHPSYFQLIAFVNNNIKSKKEIRLIKTHLQKCKTCSKTYRQLKLLNNLKSIFKIKLLFSLTKIRIYKWSPQLKSNFSLFRAPFRILAPAIASIMLIIGTYIIYNQINQPKTLAELAVSTPYPYTKLKLRSQIKYNDINWEKGMNQYMLGNYTEVITNLKKVVRSDSSFYLARFYLGVAYYLNNNLIKAKYTLEQYISQQPDKAKGYWYLIQVYLKMNQSQKALNIIQKLSELDENLYKKKAENLKNKINKMKNL